MPALKHGGQLRGLMAVPQGKSYLGRFGRMFFGLPAQAGSMEELAVLASLMVECDSDTRVRNAASNNADVTAGYTYLGQFIDHDLTFDPVTELQGRRDPEAVENFRTPRLDLDSVYGGGPATSPYMFETDGRFRLGTCDAGADDLLRLSETAVIPDPRNDENLVVSQIHLAFLKYHNRLILQNLSFHEAQRIVQWHYQWLVLTDYLPSILGKIRIDAALRRERDKSGLTRWIDGRRSYDWKESPFMPVEFSAAAFRFGHSMVRQIYFLADDKDSKPGLRVFEPNANDPREALDLRGFRRRPKGAKIQWFRFFDILPKPGEKAHDSETDYLQFARAFDTMLAHGLSTLPVPVVPTASAVGLPTSVDLASLPVRNLLRGLNLGLPSGQSVARAMGVPEDRILRARQSDGFSNFAGPKERFLPNGQKDKTRCRTPDAATVTQLEQAFGGSTPLWYYILKEAEVFECGQILGEVGGTIVSEVFAGLLLGDPESFINVEPAWTPQSGQYGCRKDGVFRMIDLLEFQRG